MTEDNSLDAHVRWCIHNYPSLYRDADWDSSRLRVLEHLFMTIGNGYQWDIETGTLKIDSQHQPVDSIPDDFYQRQLYTVIHLDWEKYISTKRRPKWWYLTDGGDLVYEADNDHTAEYWNKFFEKPCEFHHAFRVHQYPLKPYPLCKYSALVEILQGHTNEVLDPSLKLKPHADWLAGCVDIARWAWHYWNTPELYEKDDYYTTQVLRQMEIDKKYNGYNWEKNLSPGETPEQYAERCWMRHWLEQKDYLNRFLKKFDAGYVEEA